MRRLLDRVGSELQAAYGDLANPRFDFVEKRLKSGMHSDVLEKLNEAYRVQDTTDLNDDVAVTLWLEQGDEQCGLRLSLVGKYAVLQDRMGRVVAQEDHHDRQLVSILVCHGYYVLEPGVLRQRFEFENDNRTVFELLFSAEQLNK